MMCVEVWLLSLRLSGRRTEPVVDGELNKVGISDYELLVFYRMIDHALEL